VLAVVSTTRALGQMAIAPELGLGLGRMTTQRIDGCAVMPVNCDPMDPTCTTPPPPNPPGCTGAVNAFAYVGDNFNVATITPRLDAALRIALPLFDHVWLDALAAVTYAPFGHATEYAMPLPAGGMGPNINLPGEPTAGLQLALGLRVGLP
jgi:hypothetical protein